MVVSTQRPNQKTFEVKHVRTEVSMSKQSRSRSMSPASGERQGGEGLLSSPAIQRALQARRATLALAQESTSTPAGGAPAGSLLPPSAPTPDGQPASPLDGGVSLAGVAGSSPTIIPQQAIRGILGSVAQPSGSFGIRYCQWPSKPTAQI